MNKTYTTLFFDLDHTLWDFDANSAATLKVLYDTFNLKAKGINDFNVFVPRYEYHNELLWAQLRAGTISRVDLRWKRMALILQEYGIDDIELAMQMSALYLEILPKQGLLIDGALELLEYCKQKGYAMHLITNGFETTQREKLATSNIGRFFEHIITSESANAMKPHAPIFEYAVQLANINIADAIMIGDSYEADITGAMQVGMDQIYYNPLNLECNPNPTFTVKSLSDMLDIL